MNQPNDELDPPFEIIEPDSNGWICEPDDAAGIARLMLVADRAVRSEHAGRAARATAERFGIDTMATRLSDLYSALMGPVT